MVRIDDEAESMFDWMWKSFQRMYWRITSSCHAKRKGEKVQRKSTKTPLKSTEKEGGDRTLSCQSLVSRFDSL